MNNFNSNNNSNKNGAFLDGLLYVKDKASGEKKCIGSIYTRADIGLVNTLLQALSRNPDKLELVYEEKNSNVTDGTFLAGVINWYSGKKNAKPAQVAVAPVPVAPVGVPQPIAPQQVAQPAIHDVPMGNPQPVAQPAPAPVQEVQVELDEIPF